MNKKLISILIIVIGLILLAGFIYLMFFYGSNELIKEAINREETGQPKLPNSGQIEPVEGDNKKQNNNQKAIIEIEKPTPQEIVQVDIKQLAVVFAERFGSFSNQSNFGNIRDLKIFMSSNMQAWADDFISQSLLSGDRTNYTGITTKAVSSEVKKLDETTGYAEVLVKTQRKKFGNDVGSDSVYYQDIIIKLIRETGEWKVNQADWQSL